MHSIKEKPVRPLISNYFTPFRYVKISTNKLKLSVRILDKDGPRTSAIDSMVWYMKNKLK